jgi:ADP-ribose pyrophosphatase YjhB (NUDIX family)
MSIVSPERLSTPVYCQRCGRFVVERYVEHEGRTRYQCEGCGFIHYMNPRVVSAAVVRHGGRVLLQQRASEPSRGLWTFPGGFLEIGETTEAGAVRETKEEVGLDIELEGLLGIYSRPQVGIVLVVYDATSASDSAYVADAESLDVRWFAADAIPWDALAFETTEAALRDCVRRHADAAA